MAQTCRDVVSTAQSVAYTCDSRSGRSSEANKLPTVTISLAENDDPHPPTQARKRRQEELHAAFRTKFFIAISSIYACALAYVAYVVRQPYDAFPSGFARALRIAPTVVIPIIGVVVYKVMEALFGAVMRHTDKRINKVNERSEKIVQGLKDDMKFDRTEKLLRKYDREWMAPNSRGPSGSINDDGSDRSEGSDREGDGEQTILAGTQRTPVKARLKSRGNSDKPPMSLSKKLVMSTVGGVGGASIKLSGALAQLWTLTADTVIGDDPVLLRSLKNAEVHAQSLTEENARLRGRLERYENEYGMMYDVGGSNGGDDGGSSDGGEREVDDIPEAPEEEDEEEAEDVVAQEDEEDEEDESSEEEVVEMVVGDTELELDPEQQQDSRLQSSPSSDDDPSPPPPRRSRRTRRT